MELLSEISLESEIGNWDYFEESKITFIWKPKLELEVGKVKIEGKTSLESEIGM